MQDSFTVDGLKAQAKALRDQFIEHGAEISHSEALEAISKIHGLKDWNTARAISRLSARASRSKAFGVELSTAPRPVEESEWDALKRWDQQLRIKLTEVFDDLDECLAAMRHHREERGASNSWFSPDFGARGEQTGWRELQTGRGFVLSLDGLLALPEDRRRRFIAERQEIGDRVRLGVDPWAGCLK